MGKKIPEWRRQGKKVVVVSHASSKRIKEFFRRPDVQALVGDEDMRIYAGSHDGKLTSLFNVKANIFYDDSPGLFKALKKSIKKHPRRAIHLKKIIRVMQIQG